MGGSITILNSTIADNGAGTGGSGIYAAFGSITLTNSIVASSSGFNCGVASTFPIISNGYNLSNDTSCPFTATGDKQNQDPLLGPLGDNDGPTDTHALLTCSPAIQAGNNAAIPSEVSTDQRGDGFDRIIGSVVDMGAFESHEPLHADLAVTKTGSAEPVTVGDSFTYTIGVTNNGPCSATGVTLTDLLPAEVAFVSFLNQGNCHEAGGTITCDLGGMAHSDSGEVGIVVTATAGGTITNAASVAGGQDDLNASNNIATAETTAILLVSIDIKPGESPNSINLRSQGKVPIAILSTATFDARTVAPTTVTLAGAPVALKGNGQLMAVFGDDNADSLLDLVVHVTTQALQLSSTATEAVLEGRTFDGIRVRGVDSVRIVPR